MSKKVDLNKLAEEELLREAKRGASRAAVGGALAWQKCPLKPTNKRFLLNVIQHTVNSNKLKEDSRTKSYKKKICHHSQETSKKKKKIKDDKRGDNNRVEKSKNKT